MKTKMGQIEKGLKSIFLLTNQNIWKKVNN